MIEWWAVSNLQWLATAVLCLRAANSRDGRARRTWAVGFAFLPFFAATITEGHRVWRVSSGATVLEQVGFLHIPATLATLAPALYLIGWAFRSADLRWQRISCTIFGVLAFLGAIMAALLKAGAAVQYSVSPGV